MSVHPPLANFMLSTAQVVINPIELRVHLCADTPGALTGFINNLVPKTEEPEVDTYVIPERSPCH